MTLERVLTILGFVVTLCGSIIAVAVVWGRFTEKVKNLKEQIDKLAAENGHQHDAFFESRRETDRLTTKMDQVYDLLNELKVDVKDISSRIPLARTTEH